MKPDIQLSLVSNSPFIKKHTEPDTRRESLPLKAPTKSNLSPALKTEPTPAVSIPKQPSVLDILRNFDAQVKKEQVIFSNHNIKRSNTISFRPSPKKQELPPKDKVQVPESLTMQQRLALFQATSGKPKVDAGVAIMANKSETKIVAQWANIQTKKMEIVKKDDQAIASLVAKPNETENIKEIEPKSSQIVSEMIPVSERFKFFGALADRSTKPVAAMNAVTTTEPAAKSPAPIATNVKAKLLLQEPKQASSPKIIPVEKPKALDPSEMTVSDRMKYFQNKSKTSLQITAIQAPIVPRKVLNEFKPVDPLSLPINTLLLNEKNLVEFESKRNDSGAFVEMEEQLLSSFSFDVSLYIILDPRD